MTNSTVTEQTSIDRETLVQRRDQLVTELESGQLMLDDLEQRRTQVQQTLLRISGAVHVLTELLDGAEPQFGAEADTDAPSPA